MKNRLISKMVVVAVLALGAEVASASDPSVSEDARICHENPRAFCDDRCILSCNRVLNQNPYDALAHFRLAASLLNGPSVPFMPMVDTELRLCSELNEQISSWCEVLYAALTGFPDHFAIKDRRPNPASAYRWTKRAASRGSPYGRWSQATFLVSGTGIRRNIRMAYQLLSKNTDSEKPLGPFALLYGILLNHGWGGPQNTALADQYLQTGYSWLGSSRLANRVDSVYLQLIGKFAYAFGDATFMHRTIWGVTLGEIDGTAYSADNFARLIDQAEPSLIAEFVGVEQIAANLGSPEAVQRVAELKDVLQQAHRDDLTKPIADVVKRWEKAIADNMQYIVTPEEQVAGAEKQELPADTSTEKQNVWVNTKEEKREVELETDTVPVVDVILDPDYLKRVGVFLSNFSEVGIMNTTHQDLISNPELLVHFAVRHQWINNRKYFVKDPDCDESVSAPEYCRTQGDMLITTSMLPPVTKRYLDYDMNSFPTVPGYYFENNYYRLSSKKDETPQVKATVAELQENGTVVVRGRIYYPDCASCIDPANPPQVTARLSERIYNGKDYWTLISIAVKDPKRKKSR